ncbi:PHP domain-containing protein [Candidatus Woesearchaeota archaeon]|nr:PHP domain-containing protein [Candidatus Woesearchaeota archaeon]
MLNRAKIKTQKINPRKIKGLKEKRYTAFDMHYHTKYSDGSKTISEIVRKARKLGIGVAITDHNEIKGALEIAKYDDVPSIPGIEVSTKEGIHVLLYFFDTSELSAFYNHIILPVKKSNFVVNLPLKDLLDFAKDFKAVICAAHPHSVAWMGVCDGAHKKIVDKKLLSSFDLIEVMNGENLSHYNQKALKLSEELKKPIVGGSDGHSLGELGGVLTYVKEEVSPNEFLNKIKRNEGFVIGKESNIISKAVCHSKKITVPIKNPISYVKKNYNYLKKVITT